MSEPEQRYQTSVEIKTGHDGDELPKFEVAMKERDVSGASLFALLGDLLGVVSNRIQRAAGNAGVDLPEEPPK